MRPNWLYKIPAVLYSGLIFALSSSSLEEAPKIEIYGFDKLVHSLEYIVYGMTLMLALTTSRSERLRRNAALLAIIIGILFAASDELHQYFVPGRHCSLFDLLADSIGVVAGVWIYQTNSLLRRIGRSSG